ncbi:MAG TPA: hypothetical protein VIT91_07205 [Chthoniobacterales bacterium]
MDLKKVIRNITVIAVTCCVAGCGWFGKDKKRDVAATAAASGPNVAVAGYDRNGLPYYVVKADFTPIYRMGPQQRGGPDQSLRRGTLIGVIKRSFGYSKIKLESGMEGYVATDDIFPATPEWIATAQPSVAAASPTRSRRRNYNLENNPAVVSEYTAEDAARAAATSASNAEALPDLPIMPDMPNLTDLESKPTPTPEQKSAPKPSPSPSPESNKTPAPGPSPSTTP